jgi:hypothetical protein
MLDEADARPLPQVGEPLVVFLRAIEAYAGSP